MKKDEEIIRPKIRQTSFNGIKRVKKKKMSEDKEPVRTNS
jgi:hypothetical protein